MRGGKLSVAADDARLDDLLRKAIEGESMDDVVVMVGAVLGEALAAAWPDDLKESAIEQFESMVEQIGHEKTTGCVFALLAGMSLKSRRGEGR